MAEFKFPSEEVELPSKGLIYPKDHPLSSGKVEINDRLYDAASETGFIEKGQKVKVTDYTGSNLKVRLL